MTTARATPQHDAVKLDADVIIIGAGFAGLGMAIVLKRTKIASFIVLERAERLGGTWRDNTYPGCACDIPAMLYSFSFARSAEWTRLYPQQAEILAYLERTAATEAIVDRIRFDSDVAQARYDAAAGTWSVTLAGGGVLRSRFLVSAMGPLNKPKYPHVPGRERFAGPSFHSSRWDAGVELDGKNVVVIGTGASAIQSIPQIAPRVARLTVFQRTPPWVIPRKDVPVDRARRLARERFAPYAWFLRKALYWMLEIRALGFVVDPTLLERSEPAMRRYLARAVRDSQLRAKVTPAYRAGCKRILISDDYYPALARPNVELLAQGVAAIGEHAVVAADGREIPADVLIYATGFNATDGIAPVAVLGTGGVALDDVWRDGMHAYLGSSVSGFPNLFFVIGPNTGLGHNSMVFMMEAQYRYIASALRYARRRRLRSVDVKPDVMHAFNVKLQRRMGRTVWATGCSSWYQDARGKNVSLWPGFTFAFRWLTARFDPRRYHVT